MPPLNAITLQNMRQAVPTKLIPEADIAYMYRLMHRMGRGRLSPGALLYALGRQQRDNFFRLVPNSAMLTTDAAQHIVEPRYVLQRRPGRGMRLVGGDGVLWLMRPAVTHGELPT